ncbi:hypothetical protein ACUH7Y_02805 [Clostridium beijerinckii]|uniref:Uncharacterized protein n=1 Tax=Clostridium beijerinckii TaxID=1520 RepID=A0A1S8SIC3_CLOBE|nr:hypothetical protein [Clostridium beijerinckii]MBA8937463.1 hypothetical protein [Clostridium beijerinckii]NMF03750.1 hypothetical protein [Clostridium beijerinckii]NRU41444.1 hypothetical protein [Clostridium beijerinckii]NRY61453.1 hypothetical protein [Clostridium beijerinckii]NSA95280.1 hypothetical protein [Clostridium beijerinckii]
MGSYRSAYEDYYKNINNTTKGRKDKRNHLTSSKKANNAIIGSRYGSNMKSNDKMINVLIKRITKELTGATLLLLFFVGLKYTPYAQVQEMHIKCKQALNRNFNYNEYIDTFSTMQIGNIKGKDLKIGNFTVDDLKIENLKSRTFNFMEYIRNNSNMNN